MTEVYVSDNISNHYSSGNVPFLHSEAPFLAYFLEWPAGQLPVDIRFADEAGNWTDWQLLERNDHNTEKGISQLYFTTTSYQHYQLRFYDRTGFEEDIYLHFYDPGIAPEADEREPQYYGDSRDPQACPCDQPAYFDREDWCPNGDCPEDSAPVITEVTHLVVHHSAGVNTASDWSAVIRAIWDFHVNGNGWADIGYNWLVDPNGNIYQGRGDNIRGAHLCGKNSNTMGICVLGNFTEVTPAEEAIQSLEELLAWKVCDSGVDPLGSAFHPPSGAVVNHIIGHRDGCATSCPGDSFYPLLEGIKEDVNNYILSECSGLASPISLSASELSETSYYLLWNHNSPDEDGFQLERSIGDDENFELRAELDANTLTFIENDLVLDELYFYRIRAYNETDTSDYSNILEISTFPVATDEARLPENSVELAPNPVRDELRVTLELPQTGPTAMLLMDAQQRILHEERFLFTGGWTTRWINMSEYPSGVYLLRVIQGEQSGVWKILK
jgi:hypothetical protein